MARVKLAVAAAGILLLAAVTFALLEVVGAIAHLGLSFLYAFTGGAA